MAKFVVCPHEEAGEVCGFEARSEDEAVLVRSVQDHAAEEHDLSLSRADVEAMMEDG